MYVYSDTNNWAKYFQSNIKNRTSYVYIILPTDLVRFIALIFMPQSFIIQISQSCAQFYKVFLK